MLLLAPVLVFASPRLDEGDSDDDDDAVVGYYLWQSPNNVSDGIPFIVSVGRTYTARSSAPAQSTAIRAFRTWWAAECIVSVEFK